MKTVVVNLRKSEYDVYIGRAGKGKDGVFGNPHDIGKCRTCGKIHSREECIEAFREYFYNRLREDSLFRVKVESLRGKRLGCFCHPSACHGDVIVEYLEASAPKCDLCGKPLSDDEVLDHNSAPISDHHCYECDPGRRSEIRDFHKDMEEEYDPGIIRVADGWRAI